MNKQLFYLAAILFATLISSSGCNDDFTSETIALQDDEQITSRGQKHPVRRAYHDNFDTWYQFVPDVENGWNPGYGPFLAWYPGGGDGNATHVGNANTYFNQYVPFTPPVFSSVAAPVTMFFDAALAAAGYPGIPLNVSSIVYDDKGNSIWFWATSNSANPISPTRVEFIGRNTIVGGTGKFEGATGKVTLNGYFNPQDQQDAGVWQDGWIEY